MSIKAIFAYINRHQILKSFPVIKMCKTLGVSETGYYKWKRAGNKPKAWQLLLVKIHDILDEHPDNRNYGIDRVMIALEQRGEKASRSTVTRTMRKGNLLHKSRRSPDGLTKSDKKAQRPDNIIQRNFTAKSPNEKGLTDITQTPCSDGKLYIAPVFDCFGGEIISLSMANNMKKELCIQAIEEAYKSKMPGNGVIIHSDVGKCYDNARMESFFATLKKEKVYRINTEKMKMEEVKTIIWRYVMVYYNRQRISTVNEGGLPPTMYRNMAAARRSAA